MKSKKETVPLCVIGAGTILGNRRCTGWVVICPEHPKLQEVVIPTKAKARAAQASHVAKQHPMGDVLAG